MFTIAAIISLACLAVPVSIWIRMLIDRPRVRALIHSHMSEVRAAHLAESASEADR